MKLVSNPPSPWARYGTEWLGEPPSAKLEVYEETARSIISENDSPDIGFRFSLNPYRGCFHACAYCYARPTHQYLEYGAGTDFERKLVAKVNAPELLRKAFEKKSWTGETLVFSGVTDCYQPLEATYELTRGCLKVCNEYRNPVSIVTKGALTQRDVELLKALHDRAGVQVHVSLAFSDEKMARLMEPGAPLPSARLRTLKVLSEAGIPVGLALAPVIPGLNDSQIPELIERAKENGATRVFRTLLRLPAEVKPVFIERLEREFPGRAHKVLNAVREMRGGKLYRAEFHQRMTGEGERWKAIASIFDITCRRLGLNAKEERDLGREYDGVRNRFERPHKEETGLLF